MSDELIYSSIDTILDIRRKIDLLEYELQLAKQKLLREMEKQNRTFIVTPLGKAQIRKYSVKRYDKLKVDELVERIKDGQQIPPEDTKKLVKSSDVKSILVSKI